MHTGSEEDLSSLPVSSLRDATYEEDREAYATKVREAVRRAD
ncbi:hypothetical protein [Streptomyces sp. NPDC005507]